MAAETILVLIEMRDGSRTWEQSQSFKAARARIAEINGGGDHAWIGMRMLDANDREVVSTGRKK